MVHDLRDITIIGAGPTGLFGMFYAGMRQVSAQIVDALPEAGGQLTALYPEKFIFDVGGFNQILAKDLVRALVDQTKRFDGKVHLGQRVTGLEKDGDHFVLVTETDRFPTRSLIIAAGIGAFSPRRLPQPCAEGWYGRGIYDVVTNPDDYIGQKVVIIGGGDSAFDWAAQRLRRAASLTLVHRSDRSRAHAATVTEVQTAAAAGDRMRMLPFPELADIHADGERLARITLKDIKGKTTREIEADVVLPMLG